MHNSAQLRCFENGNDDFGVEAFWIGDAARVGYFVPLNDPVNGHPPSFNYGTNISQLDPILQCMRRRDISILRRIALSKTLRRDVCLYSTVFTLWKPPAYAGRWALFILTLNMINARWRHYPVCDRFSYSNDVSIVINLWEYVRGHMD